MFHLAAYSALIDNTANTDVAALNDQILSVSNGHFLPQRDYSLIFAAVMAATLNRVRIVSPTNRQITLPIIRPIMTAVLPATAPNMADYRKNPFRIRGLEELALEATSGVAMGTERFTALVGLATSMETSPQGDIFTLRGTSTTAAVANAWTDLAITWADTLPAGNYAVVGLEVQSTNAQGARLIFENQTERPGSISITGLGNRTHLMFYKGELGRWGSFRSTRMPTVQVLANAADATHVIHLDIVRISTL